MITGAVSPEGQITIPEKIREFLKVKSSDKVVFTPMDEGKVIITKKKAPPPNFGVFHSNYQSVFFPQPPGCLNQSGIRLCCPRENRRSNEKKRHHE